VNATTADNIQIPTFEDLGDDLKSVAFTDVQALVKTGQARIVDETGKLLGGNPNAPVTVVFKKPEFYTMRATLRDLGQNAAAVSAETPYTTSTLRTALRKLGTAANVALQTPRVAQAQEDAHAAQLMHAAWGPAANAPAEKVASAGWSTKSSGSSAPLIVAGLAVAALLVLRR
jgi:hypothetical protein